jgi:hypothetical protein
MKGLLSRRPSPAMGVSIIALVVALAGTSYAATQLPKNSVGAKQIKPNAVAAAKIKNDAVTGAKVKDQSLTGGDIDAATLGTVPAAHTADSAKTADTAKSADTAGTANALAPLEPTQFVGTPGQPEFLNGATNATEPEVNFADTGFYKDHDGIVHLTGFVKVGEEKATIFVLPVGFRPAAGTVIAVNVLCRGESKECEADSPGGDEQRYVQLVVAGSNATIEGTPVDGRVLVRPGVSVSLDGVSFRAES